MRFTEIDVFGVYVAPMSLMMVAAWFVTIALRRVHDEIIVLPLSIPRLKRSQRRCAVIVRRFDSS